MSNDIFMVSLNIFLCARDYFSSEMVHTSTHTMGAIEPNYVGISRKI
jgi:hypothetical protein